MLVGVSSTASTFYNSRSGRIKTTSVLVKMYKGSFVFLDDVLLKNPFPVPVMNYYYHKDIMAVS